MIQLINTIIHIEAQLKLSLKHVLTLVKKIMMKILNLKLVMLLEYQNIKIFLQKNMFQIDLKKLH